MLYHLARKILLSNALGIKLFIKLKAIKKRLDNRAKNSKSNPEIAEIHLELQKISASLESLMIAVMKNNEK